MKRLKILGLMLLALFALGAFAASMASAVEKEGLLPQGTAGSGSGLAQTLETLREGEDIACTAVKILELKWLPESDIHGLADLHFTGCKARKLVPVNTLGDEKEVILETVLFLICLVEPKTLVFGLLIEPDINNPVHIEVPATKELVLVKGAVIAELEGAGLKGKEFKYKLVGKKGDQTTATKCVLEEGKELKHTYVASKDSLSDEMASQEGKFTLTFAKEVELMDPK